MIIDTRVDFKNGKLLLINSDGSVDETSLIAPYFYVIIKESAVRVVKALLSGENVDIERTDYIPIIYKNNKYVEDPSYVVLKVYTSSPTEVPRLAQALYSNKIRIAGSNVKYVIRNSFDKGINYMNAIPIYYGFDSKLNDKISRVEGVVIDVEAVEGKPILASVKIYRPFEDVRKDDIASYELPKEMDELESLLRRYPVIYGHNVIGFDLPVLEKSGLVLNKELKLIFDTSLVLSTYSASLGVGSARSLLDVASVLKTEVGITDEELEIKKSVKGSVARLSKEELVKYNTNDVVLTCKILNSIAPFIYAVSSISAIPPTQVMQLPSGMVAEYMLLRFSELNGFIPEYRESGANLSGERVYIEREGVSVTDVLDVDIKAMYPTFVLKHYIDPTLHKGGGEFDRREGLGILYSLVKRLYSIRLVTRSLKKKDPRFEPIDKGMKAILNALAFGVQGKSSGLAVMGNPYCPEKIFYGTRDIQFRTIEYLRSKGYRVVYGDTDSFFIMLGNKNPDEIIQTINSFLSKYGLEADLEDVWELMFIYSKKNYVLRKKDKIIVKGSALHNLNRYYLPEAISLQELLKIDSKAERLKYIKEVVYSADIEDLFVRGHQQVWRLIGKDVQSWKRLKDRRERYLVVTTPWNEKPTIVLKKAHISQYLMPHSAPIFYFFLDGSNEVDLVDLEPFNIVELRSLRLDGELAPLKARYGNGNLLVYLDRPYIVNVEGLYYGLKFGKEVKYLPSNYSISRATARKPIITSLKASINVKDCRIDEDVFRSVIFYYVKNTLRRYGLL